MTNKVIIYIHGFGSHGYGTKSAHLRNMLIEEGYDFLAPSLSNIPELAIQTLEEIIYYITKNNQEVILMGTSLGGYYATYLSCKYNIKAILINPSVYPFIALKSKIGYKINYFDESKFELTQNHINSYQKFWASCLNEKENKILLLLQTGDKILDYKEAIHRYTNAQIDIEEGGSHRYDDIENKFDLINKFIKNL